MSAPSAIRLGSQTRLAALMLIGVLASLRADLSRGSEPAKPDTLGVRIETGVGTDITNELYYEDAFIDTTFLGRRRVSTPEGRYAGVLSSIVAGTRRERRVAYQLQNELSIGDKVQRDALQMSWRDALSPMWRLSLNPSVEWRHDRTFDRDQQEWRIAGRGRLSRELTEATTAELGVGGDILQSSGLGSEFLLDRNAGRASLALDHLGLYGDEWRLGYSVTRRVFPDSSVRDHLEHAWEGRWRGTSSAGRSLTLETSGQRRRTLGLAPDSRDAFWIEVAAIEGEWRAESRWGLKSRFEGEATQYDVQDSASFFNYSVARGRLALAYEGSGGWTLSAGPRGEVLASRTAPSEGYREIGGAIEFETVSPRALWSVTPSAGWRSYDVGADASPADLHSSYAFYELEAIADQALLHRLRLRVLASVRFEDHTDAAENAASLYLSTQLRWLAY